MHRFSKNQRFFRAVFRIGLAVYAFFIFYTALLSRVIQGIHFDDPLESLWTGWGAVEGYGYYLVGNILMFLPLILLLYLSFPKSAGPKPARRAFLFSALFSALIEGAQLVFGIGTFQVSDLVYNTVSGALGGWLYGEIRGREKS